MKELKGSEDHESTIHYKMYKHKNPVDSESNQSPMSAIRTLEIINAIENLKSKYKRLNQLKSKNDEKLLQAKNKIENLKKKNGTELIEELGLVPKSRNSKIEINQRKEAWLKGKISLAKVKSRQSNLKKHAETKHNISTVPEDEEEFKSSDSIDFTTTSVAE
mmetsp:Transcript_5107/g.6029  ORF Transcript_5107/g.6029 Transcript_5107/m.6029 type:complete len:162 (-) Transcript_5107:211-696(-)